MEQSDYEKKSRVELRKHQDLERKNNKREKKLNKKLKKKNRPWWIKTLRFFSKSLSLLIIVGVTTTLIGTTVIWTKYGEVITRSVTEGYEIAGSIEKEDFIQRQPTIIYDMNGKVMKELKQYEYEAPTFKDMNPFFTKGIVSVEDKRFYTHHGVDLYGTLRSVVSTLTSDSTQGGSTLTQQLVRNVILETTDVSIERKLKEQVVAQELENMVSKDEIVEHYLNNVYFGHGNYGIGPSSRYYFGKDQSELTVDEAAVIIGITNNPSLFDPVNNPENALSKRNRILQTMLGEGVISQKEHDTSVKKPLELNIKKHNIDNRVDGSDALSYAIHRATEEIMESDGFIFQYLFDTNDERSGYKEKYNETYEKTRQKILIGGYQIYTSIDPEVQKQLEDTVEKTMNGYTAMTDNGLYRTQLAVTTIDNETGEVLAIVGGRGQKEDQLNRGYQGIRQPGSAAKPLIAFGNAYELGYTPQSNTVDSAVKNGPKNWYTGYRGTMTLRYALEQSVNTVAYKLANQAGYGKFLSKLEKMQFSHLAPEDKNPIIAIGGFTKGVSTVEMASGYSTFTRDGDFIEPTNIKEIKNIVTKEVIVNNTQETTSVFQEDAAYFVIDSLKGVIESGTGKAAKIPNYPHAFGKTGTTNGNKDSYFVGGTPYYTTAVWVGYDLPKSMTSNELNLPKQLFKDWNTILHKDKKKIDFQMPKSVYRKGNGLYSTLESYSKKQETREANESERLRIETLSQRERLELEDYRIIHKLTSKEENKREKATEDAIEKARNFQMTELGDYELWIELIEKAEKLNEKVKHQRAKDSFASQINELKVVAAVKKEEITREINRQKEEERKQEEAKAQREAKIQSLQNELNNWITKINAGEQLTEAEFQVLEALMQNLENMGESVPKLDIEWIEPEPEPESKPEPEVEVEEEVEVEVEVEEVQVDEPNEEEAESEYEYEEGDDENDEN